MWEMEAGKLEIQSHFSYVSNLKPGWTRDLVSKTNQNKHTKKDSTQYTQIIMQEQIITYIKKPSQMNSTEDG